MSETRRSTVLVVDDDQDNVDFIERVLRLEFSVRGLTSSTEALRLLKKEQFDLVIVDQRMPEITGTQLLERIRTMQPRAGRVILSGFTDNQDLLAAINQCRVHRFLSKPVEPEELLACARALTTSPDTATGPALVIDRDSERGAALASSLSELMQLDVIHSQRLDAGLSPVLIVLVEPKDATVVRKTVAHLAGMERQSAILVTLSASSVEDAAAYLRNGADDVVWPPVVAEELLLRFRTWQALRNAETEARRLRSAVLSQQTVFSFVGSSPAMQRVFGLIDKIAPTDSSVLIRGETGTGKELAAKAIHAASPRADSPFVPINLSALPETLIESELFGHEVGAFTGAAATRIGRLEECAGGTLFFDEIGDLPLSVQVKLLRILQERRFQKLGSNVTQAANFRLVCATHRDLATMVEAGEFREDLFYRVNVVSLELPPLRERRDDIVPLVEHFLQRFSERYQGQDLTVSDEGIEELLAHDWPGNVRELEHTIERAAALRSPGKPIGKGLIQKRLNRRTFRAMIDDSLRGNRSLEKLLLDVEQTVLMETLEHFGGNQSAAAKKLKIARTTLRSRLRKLGMV